MRRQITMAIKAFPILLVTAATAGFAMLQVNGGKLLSVQSGSMVPSLREGDLVSVERVPHQELAVGDIITFINPADKNVTVTHRIVGVLEDDPNGNSFVTKGDANPEQDMPIEASSVVGKVQQQVPYLGYGIDFIRTLPGLILIIYLPALIIIAHEMKRLIAYYRSIKPYSFYTKRPSGSYAPMIALVAGAVVLGVAGFSATTFAALQTTATLDGNTITIVENSEEEPPEEEPPDNGNSHTTNCSNSTDVNVRSSITQSTSSGNASSSNNTNGGSAQSGSVSNSSSTSISIDVQNSSCTVTETESETVTEP